MNSAIYVKLSARGSTRLRAEFEAMRADESLPRATLLDVFARLLGAGHRIGVLYVLGNCWTWTTPSIWRKRGSFSERSVMIAVGA
jgi:hypothetical protein